MAKLVIRMVVLDMPMTTDTPKMPYFLKSSLWVPKKIQAQAPKVKQAPIRYVSLKKKGQKIELKMTIKQKFANSTYSFAQSDVDELHQKRTDKATNVNDKWNVGDRFLYKRW